MKDLYDIVRRIRDLGRPLAEPIIATIVNTIGSSYRRRGARLLLEKDGLLTGVLSGGCLEADLIERAKRVRANGRSELMTYDTSSPHEIVDGLGIGCNGKVQVLLEPWSVGAESLTFAGDVLDADRRGVIATFFVGFSLPYFRLLNEVRVQGDDLLDTLPRTNVIFLSNHQTYFLEAMAFFDLVYVRHRFPLENPVTLGFGGVEYRPCRARSSARAM